VTSARGRIDIHNRVLITLAAGGTVVVAAAGFVSYAPNRLLSGQPITLWEAGSGPAVTSIGLLGAMLLAAAFISPGKMLHYAQAALAVALLLLVLAAAGQAASAMSLGAKPAVRISLGTAFWTLAACAALAIVDALQRLGAGAVARLLTAGAIVAGVAALAVAGIFDALSIAREYANRRLLFADALSRHVALVAGSVGLAVVIGFPLGVAAARSPRLENPLFAALNLLQTVPSIALFGLLIVPLSALAAAVPQLAAIGVGGIGVAPAIIALVLYALLPVVRNTAVGLADVDRAVIEAGRGMGLTSRQIFLQVELPLALPVLLAGLRIVTVQAIGLAVVAALIGAGGLGTFVFEGLGQYAVDLVLLGALPAIFLALAADFILQTLSAVLRRHLAQ
jgi:osmoprotectant transport system permease protein